MKILALTIAILAGAAAFGAGDRLHARMMANKQSGWILKKLPVPNVPSVIPVRITRSSAHIRTLT